MNDKIVREIYSWFVYFAILILFFGSMYYEAIKIVKLTKINLLLLPIETIIYTPHYIILVILLLMVVEFIDMWDRIIEEAKIRKEKFNENNG
jgi:hypothetical protein